jgi:hypothetical protein
MGHARKRGLAMAAIASLAFSCIPTPEAADAASDTGDAPPDTVEPGTCAEVVTCLWEKSCGEDTACADGCTANASTGAQLSLMSLSKCIDDDCGQTALAGGNVSSFDFSDLVCVYETCADTARDCWPTGNADCQGVYDCIMGCPGSDASCWVACMFSGTFVAQQKLHKLFTSCPECSYDFTRKCFSQQCPLLEAACF